MKTALLLAAVLVAATATTAFAQRGSLTLGWNNCRVNGGGVQNVNFACDTNDGDGPLLVGGFIPSATANLNSLSSASLFVDIYRTDDNVPLVSWWQFTDPPVTGCRPLSAWSLDMGNSAGATCDRSYWGEVGSPSTAIRWFYPSYMQGHATLRIVVTVDPTQASATPQIGVGQESHVFGARLGRTNTTGPGSCAGCSSPMNLYFAEANFSQSNGDNFVIGNIGAGNFPSDGPKCVSWQSPNQHCPPQAVPVLGGTWGTLKSLYR